MKKSSFEESNTRRWNELDGLLDHLEKGRAGTEASRLPAMFRQVCSDLSMAQHRMYGRKLCDRLNALVVRCYQQMQRGGARGMEGIVSFFAWTFPRAVRREWKLFVIALALFWVPFGLMILAAYLEPEWIFGALSPEEIAMMDGMYGPQAEPVEYFSKEYGSTATGFMMFTFYVQHNIGIGLRMFGMGILFCLGALYELVMEGVKLGAMFGYVHYTGNEDKIWRFAISHSSFELTGLIICGVAGMRLGLGVLFPGQLPRGESIARAGKLALPIVLGGAAMVFLAAIIEGFWSPSHLVPVEMKYMFGFACWGLWAAYFILCGRGRRHA
jgi:uncharacterized membrane protein SpoIIM required for sporulation